MKTHRFYLPILLLAAIMGLALTARGADHATIEGILITASSEPGQTDRRLAAFEPTLRRILRFESYRFAGEGSTSVNVPGEETLSIGRGHELAVTVERSDGKSMQVKVRWTAEGRTLMNTGLVLRPGVPAVLGGPSTGNKGEVYAVIVVGR